jgi:hypothetical protein
MNTAMYLWNESTLGVNSQKDRLGRYYGDFSPNYYGKDLVAKFIVPDWGDKANFGIGLWYSYRPAPGYIYRRARKTNPMTVLPEFKKS